MKEDYISCPNTFQISCFVIKYKLEIEVNTDD